MLDFALGRRVIAGGGGGATSGPFRSVLMRPLGSDDDGSRDPAGETFVAAADERTVAGELSRDELGVMIGEMVGVEFREKGGDAE